VLSWRVLSWRELPWRGYIEALMEGSHIGTEAFSLRRRLIIG